MLFTFILTLFLNLSINNIINKILFSYDLKKLIINNISKILSLINLIEIVWLLTYGRDLILIILVFSTWLILKRLRISWRIRNRRVYLLLKYFLMYLISLFHHIHLYYWFFNLSHCLINLILNLINLVRIELGIIWSSF